MVLSVSVIFWIKRNEQNYGNIEAFPIVKDYCNVLLEDVSTHKKVVLRHYFSRCHECNDSIFMLVKQIGDLIGRENIIFVGANYDPVNEIVIKRVYQDFFSKLVIKDEKITEYDLGNPGISYLFYTDTVLCKTRYYLLNDFRNSSSQLILNDLKENYFFKMKTLI